MEHSEIASTREAITRPGKCHLKFPILLTETHMETIDNGVYGNMPFWDMVSTEHPHLLILEFENISQ